MVVLCLCLQLDFYFHIDCCKRIYPQKLERPAHYVEVYRSKQDLDKECRCDGSQRSDGDREHIKHCLTLSSIDHQNLFIVFFMPSKQLQITFIVSGLVQLNLLSHAATCQVQVVSYHRPNSSIIIL